MILRGDRSSDLVEFDVFGSHIHRQILVSMVAVAIESHGYWAPSAFLNSTDRLTVDTLVKTLRNYGFEVDREIAREAAIEAGFSVVNDFVNVSLPDYPIVKAIR